MKKRPGLATMFCAAVFLGSSPSPTESAIANPRETPVVRVVQKNAGAVVNISTEQVVLLRESHVWGPYGSEFDSLFDQFFGTRSPGRALKLKSVGSGVIVDENGLIITNAHVVHMARNIFVVLSDGTSIEGKLVYENTQNDLALIKVAAPKPLTKVTLGADNDIIIGETVVAIGNPLGLENSVSVGIISGKERELSSARGQRIAGELLQIDAPINPGNSGGALLNLNGELIGINMAVVQNSQSIGFAIPVKKVREAIEAYKHNRKFAVKYRGQPQEPASAPFSGEDEGERTRRWNPYDDMERIRDEMDEMFRGAWRDREPEDKGGVFNTEIFYDTSLDWKETPDGYEIRMSVAGLDKDKMDIEINERSITISGQGSGMQEKDSPRGTFRSQQFHSFLRTIPLPEDADSASVKTDIDGDHLIIRMSKKKS